MRIKLDPDKSKIQILGILVQLYKQKDQLQPEVLVNEWYKLLQELQKQQGLWDNAFKKANMSPQIADKMRMDVEKSVKLAQQKLQNAAPKQQKPTPEKPKQTQEDQKPQPPPKPKLEQKPKLSVEEKDDLLGMMFSETMKKVKKDPKEVKITKDILNEFKIPEIKPTSQKPPPQEVPKVGPEFDDKYEKPQPSPSKAQQQEVDISSDLQGLDSILESSKVPTKKSDAPKEGSEISIDQNPQPPPSKPSSMTIDDHQTKDKLVVDSIDQQHAILSNLNNTIDKYWADITETTLSRGIPKNILTKFDWIYEKNSEGNVVLTIDSFGEVNLEEKAYAKEVSEIIEQFVKKETEFSLIKKMASHKPTHSPIEGDIQKKASDTLSKLEKKVSPKKEEKKPKKDSSVFSNVMNVMDKVYTEEKPKKEIRMNKADQELLDHIGMSQSHLSTLSSSLLDMAKKELDPDQFSFSSPSDPKAREFAKWIYNKIPSLIGKEIDNKSQKKLATRLFIKILQILK